MKYVILGDTHGRDFWKTVVNEHGMDNTMYVFMGDYMDSFDVHVDDQVSNLLDIRAFKEANMDKVILLTGNHDWQYFPFVTERYSGYNIRGRLLAGPILDDMYKGGLLQMAYGFRGGTEEYLCTHAGVTNTWAYNWELDLKAPVRGINDIFDYTPRAFAFKGVDPYGDNKTQSPIWVRPISLRKDRLPGFVHIVGHTQTKKLFRLQDVILVDCIAYREYLVIDDDIGYDGRVVI